MADLYTKVKYVENEKNSLITVIKLLQCDTEQSQEDKCQTVTRAGEKAKAAKRESRELQDSNVETNNRFEILNVSDDDRSQTDSQEEADQGIEKKSSRRAKEKKANKQSRENLSGNRKPTTTPKSQTGKVASTRQDKDGSTTTVIVWDILTKHLDTRKLKRSIKKGN